MISVETQTEMFDPPTSTPLTIPAHDDDRSSLVFMDQHCDTSWSPEEEMMSESSDEEQSQERLVETSSKITSFIFILFVFTGLVSQKYQ